MSIYIYIYIYIYAHHTFLETKCFFETPKIYWYLNFNSVLLMMKIWQALEILLLWPWETPLPMQLTCFGEPFVTSSKVFIPTYFIVFPAASCWLKALGICAEGLRIRQISSTRLDCRKNTHPVKSAYSICIQSWKLTNSNEYIQVI